MKEIIFFALGLWLGQYLVLSKGEEEYKKWKDDKIDVIQNNLHDFLKTVAPQKSDEEISKTVIEITGEE